MAAKTRILIPQKGNLLPRFRGAMVGAVVGDCLGAHFEMVWNVKVKQVMDFFSRLPSLTIDPTDSDSDSDAKSESESQQCAQTAKVESQGRKPRHLFTDDTAMVRSVAASLIKHNAVDARDMAERFSSEYKRESWRGYGGSVGRVFSTLEAEQYREPHGPASRQYNGSGSYGNGGAMRIVPAALFGYDLEQGPLNSVVDAVTRVTHSHRDAVNGAKLQCAAVRAALRLDAASTLTDTDFLCTLQSLAVSLESETVTLKDGSPPPKRRVTRGEIGHMSYRDKLQLIDKYLKSDEEVSRADIAKNLGNDVSALGSVPAAIYSFLHASSPIADVPVDGAFERTIIYAVTLGGDTDTIATMAGAMAGAYYGIDSIPLHWRETCEGVTEADDSATSLLEMVLQRKGTNTKKTEQPTSKEDEMPVMNKEQEADEPATNPKEESSSPSKSP